ncbi:hypothetical protein ACRE1S_02540 [Helicobacter himalayensis]|uniref:hypothetical protein n=1 Tax=Helicobacter himalayensis TaxID=1591088 RepID=UPI003D6F321D
MWASKKEINLFLKYTLKSKNYLEFGCGGSTFLMIYATLANVTSIESDKNFIKHLLRNELLFRASKSNELNSLKLVHIDIGKVKEWGMPIDDGKKKNYPLYSQYIFNHLNQKDIENIDTIFVDGRFRVACTLCAILHCKSDVLIIIHDFWEREYYHIVLDFLECIDRVETLGIFRIKKQHLQG